MLGLLERTGPVDSVSPAVSVDELSQLITRLAAHPDVTVAGDHARNAERIDRIAVLERLKGACAAAQARLSADLLTDRLAEHAATDGTRLGLDPDQVRRGVAAEIGFARRQSPNRARRMLGLAQALTTDMPRTLAALTDGSTSEYRVELIAGEFGCLSSTDRMIADEEIGPKLGGLGDARSRHTAAGIAARLDPEAVLTKIRGAVADRRVSIRPAPDTMLRLSALVPVTSGMAAFFALQRAADLARCEGDLRSRDQYMADELIARLNNPPASVANNPPAGEADPNPPAGVANNPPAGEADPNPPAGVANNPPAGEADPNPPAGVANNPPAGEADPNPPAGVANGIRGVTDPPTDPPAGEADPAVPSPSATCGSESGTATGTAPAGTAPAGPTEPAGPAEPATGCDAYGAPLGPGGTIDLQLVMTDRALLDGDDEPAQITGYGPIPAALARHLLGATGTTGAGEGGAGVFLRRLFTDPDTGQLVAMDSRARHFPDGARRFLITRDQICRTPWCDAPIRHIDHITPAGRGGPTTIGNGQGLCANCNYTKQSPNWTARTDHHGTITTTTPTGHIAASPPPELPRSRPRAAS